MPEFLIKKHKDAKKDNWRDKLSILPVEQTLPSEDGIVQTSDEHDISGNGAPVQRTTNTYIIYCPLRPKYEHKTKRGVNQDTHTFRVKNVHSNEWANLEIISAKYAGLTGIAVPWTIFNTDAENDNPELAKACLKRKDLNTKPAKTPFYFVASQRLRGYHDLSAFINYVYKKQLDHFFPENNEASKQQRDTYIKNYQELSRLRKLPEVHHAENKVKKHDCMVACYKLLPQELRDMMDEVYIISAWLGNWDLFNWDLDNVGYTVLHKEDGSVAISPAMIDFGDCLFAGLGGKLKRNGWEVANIAAKLQKNNPNDFDPEIPANKMILLSSAIFNGCPGILLGSIPRRLPFEDLFIHNDKKVAECLNNMRTEDGSLSKGFVRGLYRISLVSDAAIDKVTNDWFHLGKEINFASDKSEDHYAKEDLMKLMKQRRDYMLNVFAPEIENYVKQNQAEAAITKQEVEAETFDITNYNNVSAVHQLKESRRVGSTQDKAMAA